MEPSQVREKDHRLSREHYTGLKSAAFTLCIKDRVPVFRDAETARAALTILEDLCRDSPASLWAALCMPDHVHLLVEGTAPEADLWALVTGFKQRTGLLLSQRRAPGRWQKDFYDHVLRGEEDRENQVLYILDNPVRAGLVEHWMEYPHKRSTVLDLSRPL